MRKLRFACCDTDAGDPKKRGRLLREGERVRFAFIHTLKARCTVQAALSGARRVAERVLRVVPAARVGTRTAGPAAPRVDPRVDMRPVAIGMGAPAVHRGLESNKASYHQPQTGGAADAGWRGSRRSVRKRFKCTTMRRTMISPSTANVLGQDFDGRRRRTNAGLATRPSSSLAAVVRSTWRRSSTIYSTVPRRAGPSVPSTIAISSVKALFGWP